MQGQRRNLELKAVDRDPRRSLEVCEDLGAEDGGVLHQRDTYFQVESRYEIVEVEDGQGIEKALAGALGIVAVVIRARRLFVAEVVRIHLDAVEDLGNFIELEAVADPGDTDLSRLEDRLLDLRRSLGIRAADIVGSSYCDLARARTGD